MDNNFDALYKKAYALLENSTPLKADCGTVCNKSCCKGDNETGMLLFPCESTALKVTEQNGRRLAVCNGNCERNERPLSCRLFPFLPVKNQQGKIEVNIDYRGYGICPLVEHCEEVKFNQNFLRKVKKAGKLLYSNPQCAEFLNCIAKESAEEKDLILKFR